ncbi:6189_t:CDS:10 [Gigaspora margarita]|uniref:Chitin synthase n=1 Tax=Gigaspora margarita TaxID=4874 RepID=A0ABN7UTK2_GIGMA|nr:6189_t:CDS:10 [Gigaspora margarita]
MSEKISEPVIEFITNNINQIITLPELYPNEDDYAYLDEYDRCIECERTINSLILSDFSLKERSFCINKLLPKSHNGLTSIATEQHKITRLIELVHGNLVIECPVHPSLLINGPHDDSKEFTHMRYTACTCNPDAFKQEKFTLRQTEYESTRQTELFILITVNDEDEILLSSTLHGIMENITYLHSLTESSTWGEDGWKKIIICIISDRNKINKRTLSYLKSLGVYQDGIARSKVNNKTVRAHIYEYTTQISIKCSKDFVDKKTMVSTQILFCLKEKNNGKTGSHQWFFNAFCPILNPRICVLIKVGAKPADKSIYYLWKAFTNDQVAGTCGKLYVMNNRGWTKLLNPIVGALAFEHNISNIMNKPFESTFGYISSLSKDFSAYRYSALQDVTNDTENASNHNILAKNDYLAKNNVLCFELISKCDFSWILHYENSSQAEVDVPENLYEIIQQYICRINEYFYTSSYAITHFYCIWRSRHSIFRKICLQIEIIYQILHFLFSWFALILDIMHPENDFFYFEHFYKNMNSMNRKIGIILFYTFVAITGIHVIFAFVNKLQIIKWRDFIPLIFSMILTIYLLLNLLWYPFNGDGYFYKYPINDSTYLYHHPDGTYYNSYANRYYYNSTDNNTHTLSPDDSFCNSRYPYLTFYDKNNIAYNFNALTETNILRYFRFLPFYINGINIYTFININRSPSREANSLTEIADINSFLNTFGKNIVEVSLPCEITIDNEYNEAWNEIIKSDKNESMCKIQDNSLKNFAPWI